MSDGLAPASDTRRTYHTLDGMRAVAAWAVVTHHAGWMFGPAYMERAYMAVDLFFVLSGFVLAHAYERRFEQGMTAFTFAKLRLIRLYPLYLAGLLISAAWVGATLLQGAPTSYFQAKPFTWDQLGGDFLSGLFFLPGPSYEGAAQIAFYPLNVPAWSLLFELVANIAFVMLWPRLTTAALAGVVAVSGAILVWAGLDHGHLNAGWSLDGVAIALPRVVFGFFAGVLLYRLRDAAPRWLKVPPGLLIVIMLAAFWWKLDGPALAWLDIGCALILFPALVFLGVQVEPMRLLRPAYAFGGVTSYAVYALHYPLVFAATAAFSTMYAAWGWPQAGVTQGVVFTAALFTLCWLLDRFYDLPVRVRLTRLLVPSRPPEDPPGRPDPGVVAVVPGAAGEA